MFKFDWAELLVVAGVVLAIATNSIPVAAIAFALAGSLIVWRLIAKRKHPDA